MKNKYEFLIYTKILIAFTKRFLTRTLSLINFDRRLFCVGKMTRILPITKQPMTHKLIGEGVVHCYPVVTTSNDTGYLLQSTNYHLFDAESTLNRINFLKTYTVYNNRLMDSQFHFYIHPLFYKLDLWFIEFYLVVYNLNLPLQEMIV